jgi:hypothetical protein
LCERANKSCPGEQRADLAIKKKEGMNALKYSTGAQATFAKWRTSVDI